MDFGEKFLELNRIKLNLFKEQNLENGLFDVTFEIGGKSLYAHKTMLNLVSQTFASMLSERWTKNQDEPIKIKNYSYDDFFQFITFLYSAKCQLTDSNIYSMVDIAEFYGVALFKDYCDEYLCAMKITAENVFQLMDMAEKYSMDQLKSSAHRFITQNFQLFANSDGFLKADKTIVEEIVVAVKDKIKPEDLFEAIYNWTEKQALNIKEADPTLNLNDAIKNEFTDFLPHIYFDKMELNFLLDYVVSRGFIFSSYKELSKILCERKVANSGTRVKITNIDGQTLHGNLILDKTVIENIKSLKNQFSDFEYYHWNTRFDRPSTPSPLKKRNDIDWYLIFNTYGQVDIIPGDYISSYDYLLAELTSGDAGFDITGECKIEIE